MSFEKELRIAIAAVRQACRLCQAVQSSLKNSDTQTKQDRSPVTIADYGAQALINRLIEESFPADPIMGEEDAAALRQPESAVLLAAVVKQVQAISPHFTQEAILAAIDRGSHVGGPSGRFWTLDPIDGTKGFIRKDQYAVALALIEDGHVRLGVLGCPNLPGHPGSSGGSAGFVFYAVEGQGAFAAPLDESEPQPIAVDALSNVEDVVLSEPVESAHSEHGKAALLGKALGWTRPGVRIDSQCKYAAVARGQAHAYLRLPTRADYQEKIWDHAAGYRIVVEAGGQVTDVEGKSLNFALGRSLAGNQGIIATCGGAVHRQIVHTLAKLD